MWPRQRPQCLLVPLARDGKVGWMNAMGNIARNACLTDAACGAVSVGYVKHGFLRVLPHLVAQQQAQLSRGIARFSMSYGPLLP
jgi:hypothetical protein